MDRISTGSLGVDSLLGGGFIPGGIAEIWGGPGTGKTTLGQHAVEDLDTNQDALWMSVGAEVPRRTIRASIVAPRAAEEAFSIMGAGLALGAKLIVVDSANGLVRSREIEGSPDYQWFYKPSPHREFAPELKRLKEECSMSGGTVVFLSKPRDKERSPIRGTGISEKASQRVFLKVLSSRQDGSQRIEASVKTGESCEYVLRPGTGIDWAEEVLRTARDHGIVTTRGSWWILPGKSVQGIDEAAEYLRGYPRLAVDITAEVRKALNI